MRVLVTGGAGYIGSHTMKGLRQAGHEPVAYDDLRHGHVEALLGAPLVQAAIDDKSALVAALKKYQIDAVMNFAAYCYVGESVEKPAMYYRNNVTGLLSVAEACVECGVDIIVLSSSAATYGQPDVSPITEETPQFPCNPYGRTKKIGEDLLSDFAGASSLRPVFLRYFNAAGCDPDGELGEDHDPETHLIPNALRAAIGARESLQIFGSDYPTRDGTCVRDFVHVTDLADAHVRAIEYAARGGEHRAFNLGNGGGFSVLEVANMAKEVTGINFKVDMLPRRPGDPADLVASSTRAREELGWEPKFADLRTIVETAWRWMEAHPQGY